MFAFFSINLPPFSANKAHYKYTKNLTTQARQYREEFWKQLNTGKNRKELERIRDCFIPEKHYLKVQYVFHIEKDKFFTKDGKISARSADVDNSIKLPQDFLFNTRYGAAHLKKLGYVNIGIDDRFITELTAKKAPTSGAPFIEIKVEIHEL